MLQHHSFVQLFSTYAEFELERRDQLLGHRPYRMSTSFAWNYLHSATFCYPASARGASDSYMKAERPGHDGAWGEFSFWVCSGSDGRGVAWRRDAFDTVGGMLDHVRAGSADWHMAFGLVQATNVAAK